MQELFNSKFGDTVLFIVSLCLSCLSLSSQNTVGLLRLDQENVTAGYTLLYPENQANVFLINNCGEIVHSWEDSEDYRPGLSAYLLDNGNLLKTKRPNGIVLESLTAGGAGGIIELRDWDNNLVWTKTIMDSMERAHHDVRAMPNGNVLVITWEKKSEEEVALNGRKPNLIQEVWIDNVKEYDPTTDSLVWSWSAWDHLVQDYDSSLLNYGSVSENRQLIDLNYNVSFNTRPDFMHSNSVDYNEELDQILLSVAYFQELWVIDHSTTTEEARGHSGGKYGKGGDLLFRWGNPYAYKKGDESEHQLYFQHDANWANQEGSEITVFNNQKDDTHSAGCILKPLGDFGFYDQDFNTYLPLDFENCYTHPDTTPAYSGNMSSFKILANGNFLFCVAQQGRILEMTGNDEIVWEYLLPLRNGYPVSQGDELDVADNVIFKANKYPTDYSAFLDRDLSPKGYIELSPNKLNDCNVPLSVNEGSSDKANIYPNPIGAERILNISNVTIPLGYSLHTMEGSVLLSGVIETNPSLDLQDLLAGMYIFRLGAENFKIIVH